LKAPVNAAAIAVGDMGGSGGVAFLSPSMVEKRQSRGAVRWLCAFGPAIAPPCASASPG
jgi:hypothetical protein